MDPLIHRKIGNYKLVEFLDAGTFGRVYRGEHLYLPKQVAIKILRLEPSSEAIADFLKEAQDLAKLKHRHIIEVIDFGFYEGSIPYLVMPLTLGSLKEKSSKGSTLDMKTILSYVNGASQALNYAHHSAKIVHRDIKPANLLLDKDGEVLVSDFGLAVIAHSINSLSPQEPLGSPAYMAPEQWNGEAIPASDQYALAICVYQWFSGDLPFHNTKELSIRKQHLLITPPPLIRPGSPVTEDVEKVIMKALDKDPEKRFANVRDFADALMQASQSQLLPSPISHPDPQPILSPFQSSGSPVLIPQPQERQEKRVSTILPEWKTIKGNNRRVFPWRNVALLFGLIFLIVTGSAGLLYTTANHQIAPAGTTATALTNAHMRATTNAQATVNAQAANTHAYVAGTAKGVMFGFDPQHTHFNPYEGILGPTNVSCLKQDWTTRIGKTFPDGPEVYNSYSFSPVVANGVIYIGSPDYNLYALDAVDGKKLWNTPTGGQINSSPAVANGVVYVGSLDHKLYALDATTGRILWTALTGNGIKSSPTVANGVVYIGSDDDKLYTFNATTGKALWSVSFDTSIENSPAIANGVVYVYVSTYGSKLYAFDVTTGKTLWSVPIKQGNGYESSPTVANGVVYIGSGDRNLYAIDATTGKTLWTALTDWPAVGSPVVANGTVYVYANKLFAFRLLSTIPMQGSC